MNDMKIITIGVTDYFDDGYVDFGNNGISTNQLMHAFGMLGSILVKQDGVELNALKACLDDICSNFKLEVELIN